jgi:hypothetical protein
MPTKSVEEFKTKVISWLVSNDAEIVSLISLKEAFKTYFEDDIQLVIEFLQKERLLNINSTTKTKTRSINFIVNANQLKQLSRSHKISIYPSLKKTSHIDRRGETI